jgi:hypothetical protein
MTFALVKHDDWHSTIDPVPYYGDDPDGCYDERHRRTIERSKLQLNTMKNIPDCNHLDGAPLQMVVCDIVE